MRRWRRGLARLAAVAEVASGGGLVAVVRRRPRSLASELLVRGLGDLVVDAGTLIDGGANEGQFTRAFLAHHPTADVVAFEPHPGAAAAFRTHLVDQPRVRLLELALGEADGDGVLHMPADSRQSALAPADSSGAGATRPVPVTTLDAVLAATPLRRPCVLKLDLQGGEAASLRGAADLLRTTVDVVVCEIAAGTDPWRRVVAALADAPFEPAGALAVLRGPGGAAVQMDVVFVRRAS